MPIPIDTSRLTFVVVTAPRPRLVSQETGEIKTDKSGRTVYTTGRVELVNVNMSGEPAVSVGQVAELAGLVGFAWEQVRGGQLRWGIAYRADSITPATTAQAAA